MLAMLSEKTSGFSEMGRGMLVSVSLLNLRLDTVSESLLGSLLNPILPSFSIATKEVRTLDRGRGDAEGEGDASGTEFVC